MSITLSIPPAIVQEVREWAEANGTSLNQYVRDCLEAKIREIRDTKARKVLEFRSFIANLSPCGLPPGYVFNRANDAVREVSA